MTPVTPGIIIIIGQSNNSIWHKSASVMYSRYCIPAVHDALNHVYDAF